MNSRFPVLAPTLYGFFTDYLPNQRAMSPHTLKSYRDSLKLLLQFVAGKKADLSQISVEQLTTERIMSFLQHLESQRRNQVATRNVRLSAIHSFFRYLAGQWPEYMEQTQRVLSIPFKRGTIRETEHLDFDEIQSVLSAVDRQHVDGRRDLALLTLMFNTGARVSEIVAIHTSDLRLETPPSVLLRGKGKKQRTCPLWPETATLLRRLIEERGINPTQSVALFLNRRGTYLTRFGVRIILNKHIRKAARSSPSLNKKRLHPHSARHSTAIHLLRSGVDLSTIAHWLGHASINTTNRYLAIDLETKREALAKAEPLLKNGSSAKWRRNINLINWLETL